MRRLLAILLFAACSVMGSTPSYWFGQLQTKPDAQQAQEFWFLPGTGVNFTYGNNHVFINSTGGGGGTNVAFATNSTYAQYSTNWYGSNAFYLLMIGGTNSATTNALYAVLSTNWTGSNLLWQAMTNYVHTNSASQTNIYATNLLGFASGTGIYFSTNSAGTLSVNYAGDITAGLMAWWRFNEGAGTTAVDSTGNGHTATLSGSPLPLWTTTSFLYPTALAFNNNASYVDAGINSTFNITTNDFSICAWVYHTNSTYTTWEGVLSSYSSSYVLRCLNGIPEFYCNYAGPGVDVVGSTVIPQNTWYFIVASRIGSNFSLYTNGVLEASAVNAAVLDNQASPGIVIGNDENITTRRFRGVISEVRVYSRYGLTAADVSYLYKTHYGIAPSPLSSSYVQKSGDYMQGALTNLTTITIVGTNTANLWFEIPDPGFPGSFLGSSIEFGTNGFDFHPNSTFNGSIYQDVFVGVHQAGLTPAGVFFGDGSGLTNLHFSTTGITITQHVTDLVLGSITNLFSNGVLVATGTYSIHGSSLIKPGGGYLIQPNLGSILLP